MNAQPAASDDDLRHMRRALQLARRGEGHVEPNPMVGCVLVRDGQVVGEGWHQKFGGPHAEVEALTAAGPAARGATAYVTLEPCSHVGKTPPCTQALIRAGVARVSVGARDPNPHVSGGGLAELAAAGIKCDESDLAEQAADLIAPFSKLVTSGRPWVIAKWAMTLDGKLATRTGDSRWISGEESRAKVHELRGRVDAIIVGAGTAEQDDPLLTARPPGPRTATRIVLAASDSIPPISKLLETSREAPVLVAVTHRIAAESVRALTDRGVELWQSNEADRSQRWSALLDELGRRQMTNVLVEGGAQVLGTLFDAGAVDEVHAFVAPKLAGGGPSPVAGAGVSLMSAALSLKSCSIEQLGADVYIHDRLR
jgi:diaminohydroxyphosphoribosylaminopyrimidine deaminase/5-amino-6-(5-phosphoribosylamino)uracil reductase